MRVSVVSDEISSDFETAVELGTEWGIAHYELRTVGLERVPDLPERVVRRVGEVLAGTGVRLTALSPGVFKLPYDAEAVADHLGPRLEATFRLAERWDCRTILIFGLERRSRDGRPAPAEAWQQVVDCLGVAAARAERAGFLLALENEPGYWADTGEATAALVRAVGSPALRVNWDLGNAWRAGDRDIAGAFAQVRPYVVNVHAKDWLSISAAPATQETAAGRPAGRYVPIGQGEIDWRRQLTLLREAGYEGFVAVETHFRPRVEGTRASLAGLRRLARLELGEALG